MSNIGYIAQRSTNPNLVLRFLRELPEGTLESRAEIIPNFKAVKAKYKLRSPKMVKALLKLGVNADVLNDYYSHNPNKIIEGCEVKIWHEFSTPGCSAVMRQQSDSTHFTSCMRSGRAGNGKGEYYHTYIEKETKAFERGSLGIVVIGNPYESFPIPLTPSGIIPVDDNFLSAIKTMDIVRGDGQGFRNRAKIRILYDIASLKEPSVVKPAALYVDRVYGSCTRAVFYACIAEELSAWWDMCCEANGWGKLPILARDSSGDRKAYKGSLKKLTFFGDSYGDSLYDGCSGCNLGDIADASVYESIGGKTFPVTAHWNDKQTLTIDEYTVELEAITKPISLQLKSYKAYRDFLNGGYYVSSPSAVYIALQQSNYPKSLEPLKTGFSKLSNSVLGVRHMNVDNTRPHQYLREMVKAQLINDVRECLQREVLSNSKWLSINYEMMRSASRLEVEATHPITNEVAKIYLNYNGIDSMGRFISIELESAELSLTTSRGEDESKGLVVQISEFKKEETISSLRSSFITRRRKGKYNDDYSTREASPFEKLLREKFEKAISTFEKIYNFYSAVLDIF